MKKVFSSIKNYFSEWNWFELSFIFFFEILYIVLGIIFKQDFFSCFYSMTILLCAFFIAKGKWYAYIFGIIGILTYCYLSFTQQYWAEAIWHLVFTVPMYVVSLINWFRNQQNKEVKIRKISKLETILFIIGLIVMCAAIWLVLYLVKAPQPLVSAFSVTLSAMANYLAMRRSDFSLIAFCFDDIFIIVLWLIPVIQGEVVLLNVAITMFAFLINDIYGVINWRNMKAKQAADSSLFNKSATTEQN